MFELPVNKPSVEDARAVASLICEAFYNEREWYKCHMGFVSRMQDGKAVFGIPDKFYGEPVEKRRVTKEAFDLALDTIKRKGWHIYKRVWCVASGLNWSYVMCDEIPMRVYNGNNFTIIF